MVGWFILFESESWWGMYAYIIYIILIYKQLGEKVVVIVLVAGTIVHRGKRNVILKSTLF